MKTKPNKKAEAEKALRIANYQRQREEMTSRGYTEHSGIISVLKANLLAFVTAGPFALLAVVLYLLRWRELRFIGSLSDSLVFLGLFLLSVPVHELIHGVTWRCFCKNGWKSIHFGIMWDSLTPYCHCMEPLRFGGYIIGGLMPFLVLGVGVSAVAILVGNSMLLCLGALSMLGGGGDTTIALMLLKYRDASILDHPTECGFVAFRR